MILTGKARPDSRISAVSSLENKTKTVTLCRLSGRGSSPAWSGKHPPTSPPGNAGLFQAAIRACEYGCAEAAEQFWQQARTLWSRHGRPTARHPGSSSTRA